VDTIGGVARRATVIRIVRSQAQHALVLDAGNSLVGDQEPALRTRGRTSVEAMNLMKYDALALGMGDISLLGLAELRQRMGEAHFPMLSANAYVSGTEDLVADPYTIISMADHRVGVLGLTDVGASAEVRVANPLEAAEKWLPELRKKADIVVLLSHAGLDADQAIAAQVPGIDVIVSGRNPTIYELIVAEPNGVLLVHADTVNPGSAGKRVGVAYLSFSRAGRLIKYDWDKLDLTPEFKEDPEMTQWLGGIGG